MAFEPCVSCHEAEGKYKCPQCTQRTCSVVCSKKHKETHPVQDNESPHPKTGSDVSSQGTKADSGADAAAGATAAGKPQKANQLADMPEYQMLMKRYPQLLTQLSGIAAATDPPPSPSSLPDPVATSAASRYTGKKQEPWTPDIGIQKGMEVLKSARQARGADSEGIREFIELHRLWQARQLEEKQQTASTDEARRKLAQADAQAINVLLQKERASV
ncbi:hypothetical protein Micbo1qcDRAFT_229667 [Microdochium bolleyi]|uniref:HIT-type domain-containing protein n=1 Tax=Microdochium bolleyi TaxID=196109 RepID=A0A136JI97_9PEZI|nr:hypothetical protein Micbo1qcDRAFT_229667 [Microdochium bolleyi]